METQAVKMFVELLDKGPVADYQIITAIVVHEDDKITLLAIDQGIGLEASWRVINEQIADLSVKEVIFGADRYARPGQDVDTDSLVTVYHWERTASGDYMGWTFGVIPYNSGEAPRPLTWDCPFWRDVQRKEVEAIHQQSVNASRKMMNGMGLPDEALEFFREEMERVKPKTQEEGLAVLKSVIDKYRPSNVSRAVH